MTTAPVVWKTCWSPPRTSRTRAENSGPRWSIVGRDNARRQRSGTLVGPGIWRKWRPLMRPAESAASLVPQGVDRIERRGLGRRVEAEKNADSGREAERQENRRRRDPCGPLERVRD